MNIKKNNDIKLKIEAMTSEGSAIGHYDGVAVFVRGAVPGDEIIAHVIKVSKKYLIAVIKEIVVPSSCRIESDCPVSSKCGGCSFRNMTYDEELRYKKDRVQDALLRIGHIDAAVDDIIGADDINHYRNKAQYPVSICDGELCAGFYAYKSHRIIPAKHCMLQPDIFEDCINAFSKWVKAADITSYDEKSGKGLLRHIYIRRTSTGDMMVCAVINGDTLPKSNILIDELSMIDGVKSICVNINKNKSNVILSSNTKTLWGSDTITDFLLGKKFVVSPNSFYQVNHNQCEKLYLKAAEYAQLSGVEIVVDLYCGAGTIGLTMAEKAKKIFGVEIVPQAIENAKINAQINDIENAEFFCGDAYKAAKELENRGINPDVVILDPPRKGCQKELFDVIEKMNPKRVVYVSCDSATLARDLAILAEKNYCVEKITAIDMFPRTPHVESVVLLSQQKPENR